MAKKSKRRRETRREANHSTKTDNDNQEPITPPKPAATQPVQAKNEAQGQYMAQIVSRDIVFGVGPAGTGKTYISARMAAEQLKNGDIEKVVIVRPTVGCDEDLGHLPGELEEKFEPWLEPFYDALEDELGSGCLKYYLKSKKIEPKPLQFMRGKSFKDTWVLLDEGQNTTPEQMKMFLTRIGENCKLIISGDISQHDRRNWRREEMQSGLKDAVNRLREIPEIGIAEFANEDIIRHRLIGKILKEYERPGA